MRESEIISMIKQLSSVKASGWTEADGIYTATYNFEGDTVGQEPSGWTSNNDANCTTTIIEELDGHSNILQFYDNNIAGACVIEKSITQAADRIFGFYIAKNDVTNPTELYIRIQEDATILSQLRFQDNDFDYYDGAYKSIKDGCMIASQFIHVMVCLDDTANTLDVYINGSLEGAGLAYWNNSTVGFNKFVLFTDGAQSNYYCYIDAIGIVGVDGYEIGDNLLHDAIIKTDSLKCTDIISNGWEEGKIGYEMPFEYVRAKYIQDDDGAIGSYDMIDDLQAIRELEIAEKPELINNRILQVYKVETLPWAKREVVITEHEDPEDPESPIVNQYTKIIGKRYNTGGEKIGFLLSSIKKLLEYIDNLEERVKQLEGLNEAVKR